MRSLTECRLYGIMDLGYVEARDVECIAADMIEGGVDLIQLRGKKHTLDELTKIAARLEKLTAKAGLPLIGNDHPELAERVALQGIHVGQDDAPIAVVRKRVDRKIWVGKSTHSREQARIAQTEGADYIGFGPLFATPTKPDYPPIGLDEIGHVHAEVDCPIFCIGGIKLENLEQVVAAGAKRVVIVSGLLKAKNLVEYAQQVKQMLTC